MSDHRNERLPIEVDVSDRRVLIAGGCAECANKIERLTPTGAEIVVIASGDVDARIEAASTRGDVRWERRVPTADDAEGAAVVFVSPDLESLGAVLADAARREGRLVCTLDRPEHCTFANPSVFRAAGLRFSVSSGGRAPGLVRFVRETIQRVLGDPNFEAFVDSVVEERQKTPRGQRPARTRELLAGLRLQASWHFPDWFTNRRKRDQP